MSDQPKVYNKYHYDVPKDAVYIGRPSKWGNPFKLRIDGTREEIVLKFRNWLLDQPELVEQVKKELVGKNLVCYCKPAACHGDILLEIANT